MSNDRISSPDRTAVDVSLLILRLVLGIIFMAHGSQKMFGMFGGPGLSAMVQPPPNGMGPLGYLVSIGEFFGGVGIVFGFLSRFSAASIIVIMIGAIVKVHRPVGFFSARRASNTTWRSSASRCQYFFAAPADSPSANSSCQSRPAPASR